MSLSKFFLHPPTKKILKQNFWVSGERHAAISTGAVTANPDYRPGMNGRPDLRGSVREVLLGSTCLQSSLLLPPGKGTLESPQDGLRAEHSEGRR